MLYETGPKLHGPLPPAAAAVPEMPGMDVQLRIQDRAAQALDRRRRELGALQFETIEVQHVFDGEMLQEVRSQTPNRAKALIENLMIAANGATARFLDAHGFPSIRRVVKTPADPESLTAAATPGPLRSGI